jgi:hypothetical protein
VVHHRAGVLKLRRFKNCLRFQTSFSMLSSNLQPVFKDNSPKFLDLTINKLGNNKNEYYIPSTACLGLLLHGFGLDLSFALLLSFCLQTRFQFLLNLDHLNNASIITISSTIVHRHQLLILHCSNSVPSLFLFTVGFESSVSFH